mmetsp:Transcript_5467/g.6394  ORF Transcript_5467/g.6394 Transcript_5467/m.6394 type:complete len:318 (+) Transcript_5467:49-1002(+)
MLVPKLIVFALLASAVSVGAFTAPRPSLGFRSKTGPSQYQPVSYNNVDPSLMFWKKDDAQVETSKAASQNGATADDNLKNDLIAPSIYASYTGLMIYSLYQLCAAITTSTIGSFALSFVTGALIWENMVISIGSFFFKDIDTNPTKFKILKALSYPRFTLHAVGIPFQCVTIAEMGKAAGVGFLKANFVQTAIIAVAAVVAVLDHKKFVDSPGITPTTFEDSPFDALERDLTKFSYVKPELAYVIPAIVCALSNLVVGIAAMKVGAAPKLAKWMTFAGASALVGNALPGAINTFSGSLGEAGMQYGLLNAARIIYGR